MNNPAKRDCRPLIITGTGRCGTKYAAELLTAAGIPCTHEYGFDPHANFDADGVWVAPDTAEASWLAAPFIHRLTEDNNSFLPPRIIHLTRHPLAVLNSLLGIRFFNAEVMRESAHAPYIDFIREHCPIALDQGDEIARCIAFIVQWSGLIERQASHLPGYRRIQVERLDVTELIDTFGVSEELAIHARETVPLNVNARQRAQLTWKHLHHWAAENPLIAAHMPRGLAELCEHQGY